MITILIFLGELFTIHLTTQDQRVEKKYVFSFWVT